eukprot:1091265-Rhodomonas_salina.1
MQRLELPVPPPNLRNQPIQFSWSLWFCVSLDLRSHHHIVRHKVGPVPTDDLPVHYPGKEQRTTCLGHWKPSARGRKSPLYTALRKEPIGGLGEVTNVTRKDLAIADHPYRRIIAACTELIGLNVVRHKEAFTSSCCGFCLHCILPSTAFAVLPFPLHHCSAVTMRYLLFSSKPKQQGNESEWRSRQTGAPESFWFLGGVG